MRLPSRPWPVVLAAIAALTVLAGCGAAGSPTTAAEVNGDAVPVSELQARYEAVEANPQFAEQLAADEDGVLPARVRAQILTDLIDSRLVNQGAADLGLEVSDDDVAERREQLVAEVGGEEQFEALIQRSGLSLDSVDSQVRTMLLFERIQEHLGEDIRVTDAEIAAYFDEHRAERYELAEARHILVETEEEARQVLDRLAAGEDFAALAEELSADSASAARGGDLGEFGRGQMVEEFEQAVFSSEPGEIVGPVQTVHGFHVIEVTGRSDPSLDEVEDDIRSELVESRRGEAVEEWLAEQARAADITVNPRFGTWDAERGEVVPPDGLDAPAETTPEPPAEQ